MKDHMKKYHMPKSLTWWASCIPLVMGLFIAFEPVHGLAQYADSVRNATGTTAPILINAGLVGIGLRAAVK